MANVKKCDRCGKIYDDDPYYLVPFIGTGVRRHVRITRRGGIMQFARTKMGYMPRDMVFDLCDDCMKELSSWMQEKK